MSTGRTGKCWVLYVLNLVALGALVHLSTGIDVWALFPAIAALSIVTWIMIRASIARTRKECPLMEFLRGQSTAQARIRHAAVWDLHLFLSPLTLRFRMVGGVLKEINHWCVRLLTNCCRRRVETRAPEQWR